ncbi:MAG: ABC transporter ATP-binding protein [Lachnospiraceae bacterium]|jgi:ATP-binding cassette subfamily B multidrug efflux pump
MSRLRRFFRGYEKQAVLAPLFKLLEALMNLFVPLAVASIINDGIAGADRGVIVRMFAVLLVLALLGMLFSFVAQWFAANASVGFATQMRQELFDHIQKLSFEELDTLRPDTLITRMTSDANQVQNGLNLALRLLLRSPFIVFGSMILAFTIDVKSALIFAVAIPILCVVVFAIMLASIPLFTKAQRALDSLTGITRENLSGVRVIRAFCKEKEEVAEFDRRSGELTRINEFVGRLSALMNPLTYAIINIATIVLIRTGAIQVSLGALRQGDVVALYNYMAQITVELIKLANLIITINRSLACARRIADVFDIQPGMSYPAAKNGSSEAASADAASAVPAVRFRDVSFTYKGAKAEALSGISFTAPRGSTVGIIGGTGCGKSTLVNLIARFYDATKGKVEVNGRDVKDYPEGSLISRIGFVPQKAVLFRGTVRDNLRWGNENASDEELWEALSAAQARDVIEGKPGQLDFPIEQNGRNLSGGQRQRLTIARALVKKPEILIMDDSASALDFATDLALRRAVRAMEGSMTIFIVSQRASSIRGADQILVLDDGRLAGCGTHEELMSSCSIYQEIYYSQYPDERPGNQAAGKEES